MFVYVQSDNHSYNDSKQHASDDAGDNHTGGVCLDVCHLGDAGAALTAGGAGRGGAGGGTSTGGGGGRWARSCRAVQIWGWNNKTIYIKEITILYFQIYDM